MRIFFIWISIIGLLLISACEQEVPVNKIPYRYTRPVFDSIQITKDIYYRTSETIAGRDIDLFLDFYEPYGDSLDLRPLIILMHGGGFIQGNRGWMNTLAEMLPLYGYSCASISYRLYDGDDFPLSNEDFLESFFLARQDMIAAINYFVYHASGIDAFHTDVNNIFVAGSSAGAISALHAIPINFLDTNKQSLQEIIKKMEAYDSIDQTDSPMVPIRGILSFAGAILDTDWITPDYPDVFCIHGTSDNIVPYSDGFIQIANIISPLAAYGSEMIVNKASKMGLPAILIPDEGAGHDNFFNKTEPWKDQAIEFLFSSIQHSHHP